MKFTHRWVFNQLLHLVFKAQTSSMSPLLHFQVVSGPARSCTAPITEAVAYNHGGQRCCEPCAVSQGLLELTDSRDPGLIVGTVIFSSAITEANRLLWSRTVPHLSRLYLLGQPSVGEIKFSKIFVSIRSRSPWQNFCPAKILCYTVYYLLFFDLLWQQVGVVLTKAGRVKAQNPVLKKEIQ